MMGTGENFESACSSSRVGLVDEVEEVGVVSLGERLGECVVEPLSRLGIGSPAALEGDGCLVMQSVSEKHCCSVSDHQGVGSLDSEDGDKMECCSMPIDRDAKCEVMADVNEVGNISRIKFGLRRICFEEVHCKSGINPGSNNPVGSSHSGQLLAEVLPVVSAASCTTKVERDCAVGVDNPSMRSVVEVASNITVSGAVDDDSSKSLFMPDEVRLGSVITDVVESSDHVSNEGKSNASTENSTCEVKGPDVACLSLRRSSRARKSFQKLQGGKQITKCSKKNSNFSRGGKIDLLSEATRKKRSCLRRSLCSSEWGLSVNLSKYFKLSCEVSTTVVSDKGLKKGRAIQRSRKKSTLKVDDSSKSSEGREEVPHRPIRLKVTFGKKKEQVNVECKPPVAVDGLSVGKDSNQRNFCSYITSTGGNIIDDSFRKKMPLLENCRNSVDNIQFPGTDLEICSVQVRSTPADSTSLAPEKLCSSHTDKFLDPGTSPDSEVIDQLLDSTVGMKVSTVVDEPSNITSTGTADLGNVSLLSSKKSKKKRNKKDKVCQAGVENKPRSQSSISTAKVPKKRAQQRRKSHGFCSTDAGITTPSENPSSNISGIEPISTELLSISDKCPLKGPSLETDADSNICSAMGVGIESTDSGNSCQLLPPDKTQVNKISNLSKSKAKFRTMSKSTDAKRNQKDNSGKVKVNKKRLASKGKVNKNGKLDEASCEGRQSETGNLDMIDSGKPGTNNGLALENLSCRAVLPTDVREQLLPPRSAWVCCDDCLKWRCIPAQLADVIEETNSRWTCKDNQNQAFADCSIPQEKSNAEINAELQISDDEDARDGHSGSKSCGIRHLVASQPSTWMLIKSNLYMHRSRKTQTMDEIMVCHCKPPADGGLGCGSQCLNRMLNIECVLGTCPCGDLCSNQRFQQQQYANLSWFRCGKKGYGLQVLQKISKGQFLIEYVGEVLDLQTYELRQMQYASKGHKHFYFMTLNGNEVIDACVKGNVGRFVNHSCDPNCRTEKWVVNGEICVGLFALRNIREGEELTFDYNYVRVFGAAAKKCHCGSLKCRGYIGGDPRNAEVIVQCDSDEEFPEPIVVNENGEIDHTLKNMMTGIKLEDVELGSKTDNLLDEPVKIILEGREMVDKTEKSSVDVGELLPTMTNEEALDDVLESSYNLAALLTEDVKNEALSAAKPLTSASVQHISTSTSSPTSGAFAVKGGAKDSLSGSIDSSGKLSKVDKVECDRPPMKPRPRMKISRQFKSVKDRKPHSISPSVEKGFPLLHRSQVLSYKPKKLLEGSANCHLEAVEEKLNELLDDEGGVCKRKDASKGYLKLLLLTAASGDSCNDGAIQSNRDLSMILDAILKTKSRGVLLDIINKNGLQMLHNMMKLYRKDFKKIPILRKLLKVLEFLAEKEILTIERINGDPIRPGVESFRESILFFTEHEDKKVHQIARNFRDRWIPRPVRKVYGDKVDRRRELNRSLYGRSFETHHQWQDHGARSAEPMDCCKQSVLSNFPNDTGMEGDPTPLLCGSLPITSRPRKRKSRWDQPADPVSPRRSKEQRIQSSSPQLIKMPPKVEIGEGSVNQTFGTWEKNSFGSTQILSERSGKVDDVMLNSEDDAPPGFSSQKNSEDVPPGFSFEKTEDGPAGFSSSHSPEVSNPLKCSSVIQMGLLQERFNSHLPVAHGLPFSIMHKFGTRQLGTVDGWAVAPGMPFQPFPPLPPYPYDIRDSLQPGNSVSTCGTHEESRVVNCLHADSYRDQGIPSSSGASLSNVQSSRINQHLLRRGRNFSNSSWWKCNKKRKWNHVDNRAPWVKKRFGCDFRRNQARNGVFSLKSETLANKQHCQHLADVNHSVECAGDPF